jgi:D-alanyl-D-alanine carboxypeptidase
LQHPDYSFSPGEYLEYIEGKPLTFVPGSRYSYRNTNYLILALIADELTGDHAKFLSDIIFKPLELTNTFYRGSEGYLNYSNLVNTYWDRYSDGVIENASTLQRNNVAALIGDDGVVATSEDAVKFLKGLMEGKLISSTSLELMKTWAKDKNGNPTYGLGLDHATLGGQIAYGHSGGGIGEGCQLYYFPEQKVYTFIGINLGTVTESPLHEKAMATLERIYKIILY